MPVSVIRGPYTVVDMFADGLWYFTHQGHLSLIAARTSRDVDPGEFEHHLLGRQVFFFRHVA